MIMTFKIMEPVLKGIPRSKKNLKILIFAFKKTTIVKNAINKKPVNARFVKRSLY